MSADQRPLFTLLSCFLCIALIAACAFAFKSNNDLPNSLALGLEAKTTKTYRLPYYRPAELTNKTKAEILSLRKQMVSMHPKLVAANYEPSHSIFGNITDNAPWFSLQGHYVFPIAQRTTRGASYEARFIMNPFNLVGVEFWGLTGWGKSQLRWSKDKISAKLVLDPTFPLYNRPAKIEYEPLKSTLSVQYRVKDYIKNVNRYASNKLTKENAEFGLISYNARDFGYNYIFVDQKHSSRISLKYNIEKPLKIMDRIERSERCSFKGGCFYHQVSTPEYDYISLDDLPASAQIKLWKSKPDSTSSPADLKVVLHFN